MAKLVTCYTFIFFSFTYISFAQNINNNLTASYQLKADINCSALNFTQIESFTGNLNGNYYKISNININSTTFSSGVFRSLNGGFIYILDLLDVTVTSSGSANFTTLLGYAFRSTISNIQNNYQFQ